MAPGTARSMTAGRRSTWMVAVVAIGVLLGHAWAAEGDEHWSRQFPEPARSTEMTAAPA